MSSNLKRSGGGDKYEPTKKQRLPLDASEVDSVFKDFPDDKIKQMAHICGHFLCWPGTQRKPVLTSIKFVNSNASDENEGIPFSRAYCSVKPTNAKNQVFGSIFLKGIDILLAYFTERKVPECTEERHVLRKLLSYLRDTAAQAPLLKLGNLSEADLTVVLANHLFGKLAASPKYVIDNNYAGKNHKCPCGTECMITGYYGDTSIGNEDVWHGSLDIIINHELAMINPVEKEESTSDSIGGQTSVEVKKSPNLLSRSDQIIAETIVFSFLQKQYHPERVHFLFPCIGVASTALVMYFYDSENDILLESSRIPLLDSEMEINLFAILASWLVVNYKYLSSGLPKSLIDTEKAGFFNQAKEKIEIYKSNLKFGNVSTSYHVLEMCNQPTDTDILSDARSKFLDIAFKSN